jgi:flagellar basal body-associated protein FliL
MEVAMADDAALEEAPPAEEKRRGLLVPLVATALLTALIAVGGTVGVLAAMGQIGGEAAPAEGAAEGMVAQSDGLPESVVSGTGIEFVPLKKFTTDLRDGSGRKILLDISLEGRSLDGKSLLSDGVILKEAAIRDTVIMLLASYTMADIRGTDGMMRLRDEIHKRIDVQLEEQGVRLDRVYFTDVHFN